MKEAAKSIVSKTEVNNALDLGDKNKKKLKKFKHLIQVMSLVNVILKMMERKTI